MKILAILRPPAGSDVSDAVMRRAAKELRALWGLYRTGFVREMYSPGGPGAILVLEAGSTADAQSTLGELPLLRENVMQLELIELQAFAAFERLFAPESSEARPPS